MSELAETRVEVVKQLMGAWSAHDVDGVVALVTDDCEWHYAVGMPPVHGKEAMATFLSRLSSHQLDIAWKLVSYAANGDQLLIEGVDDYVNPDGHRVQVPYMGAYDFRGDLICGWRDYVDMRTMQAAEKGGGVPEHLEALVARGAALS